MIPAAASAEAAGEAARDQQAFVGRMLRTYPFEPRNMAVALMWIGATLRRLSVVTV